MNTFFFAQQVSGGNPFGGFSGDQLLVWLAILFALLVMAEKGFGLWGRISGKPPIGTESNPVHNQPHNRAPTWAEMAALERRLEKNEEEIKSLRREMVVGFVDLKAEGEKRATRLMGAVGDSATRVHTRINEIADSIAYLRGMADAEQARALRALNKGGAQS